MSTEDQIPEHLIPTRKTTEEMEREFEEAAATLKGICGVCEVAVNKVGITKSGEPKYRHTHPLMPGVKPHEVIINGEVPEL